MDIKILSNMDWFRTIYYSWCSSKVHNVGRKKMICNTGSVVQMGAKAYIDLRGHFFLGDNKLYGASANFLLRMDEDAKLRIGEKGFSIYYGSDIVLFPGAELKLGSGFINSYAKIRCHKSIEIGDGVAISHDFTVMDSDAHEIIGEGSRKTAPVKIGNHVWIGTRVTVLKGVTIGDDAVIGAGSVVTHDVPPHSLAVGIPARVVRENVDWRT